MLSSFRIPHFVGNISFGLFGIFVGLWQNAIAASFPHVFMYGGIVLPDSEGIETERCRYKRVRVPAAEIDDPIQRGLRQPHLVRILAADIVVEITDPIQRGLRHPWGLGISCDRGRRGNH